MGLIVGGKGGVHGENDNELLLFRALQYSRKTPVSRLALGRVRVTFLPHKRERAQCPLDPYSIISYSIGYLYSIHYHAIPHLYRGSEPSLPSIISRHRVIFSSKFSRAIPVLTRHGSLFFGAVLSM
eukprot:scaffold286198_cov55-Attheya_sp.AAC.1